MAEQDCCGNCFYAREIEDPSYTDNAVECHEDSPKQRDDVQRPQPFPFPVIDRNKWCGKYKPKPPEQGEDNNGEEQTQRETED